MTSTKQPALLLSEFIHRNFSGRSVSLVSLKPPKVGIKFPVVQDNGFDIWKRYGVRAWPTIVLVDRRGIIRYSHIGEGAYPKTEAMITQLLAETS